MNNILRIISDLQRSCTYGEHSVDEPKHLSCIFLFVVAGMKKFAFCKCMFECDLYTV